MPKAIVKEILAGQSRLPSQKQGQAFAPANVALCKYWGKRHAHFNLPVTSSLSVSLGSLGAQTTVTPIEEEHDCIILNGNVLNKSSEDVSMHSFIDRIVHFLDLFRHYLSEHDQSNHQRFLLETSTNIPVSAGLASSASGFAALVLALQDLYQWKLSKASLSILARLGSGSACRSLWQGFVEWDKGCDINGFDSFGSLLADDWHEFRVGILIINPLQKILSSRQAMQNTVNTSEFYAHWPKRVAEDLTLIKEAIKTRDFHLLGKTAESNALCMHALMNTAKPPIVFSQSETVSIWHEIWHLRQSSHLPIYFTQDAGPNLKLLFLEQDESKIKNLFPQMICTIPMAS